MKIIKEKLSNKALYMISITTCIVCFAVLIAYLVNIYSYENKSMIGKPELFVEGIISPQGIAFNRDGRLFVQSNWDGKISIISKDGTAMDYSYIEKHYGYGMDIDYSYNFTMASMQQVTVYDNSGNVLRSINGFNNAYDVVKGPGNLIFVSDSATNNIYRISQENEVTLFAELGEHKSSDEPNATGICFDKDYRNLYVANMYKGDLYKISLSKNFEFERIDIIASNLQKPNFIDIDEQGNVFITCIGDNTIVRVNQNSVKELVDTKGKVMSPSGIAISDNNGNVLYVGSKDNNSVYKINIGTMNQTKK